MDLDTTTLRILAALDRELSVDDYQSIGESESIVGNSLDLNSNTSASDEEYL